MMEPANLSELAKQELHVMEVHEEYHYSICTILYEYLHADDVEPIWNELLWRHYIVLDHTIQCHWYLNYYEDDTPTCDCSPVQIHTPNISTLDYLILNLLWDDAQTLADIEMSVDNSIYNALSN